MGKYGNIKTTVNGLRFDSKGEAERWIELVALEKSGAITSLERQVRYPLVVNGKKVCDYIADFRYAENGKAVVEDFKGVETQIFKLKAKLFAALYGQPIRITRKRRKASHR